MMRPTVLTIALLLPTPTFSAEAEMETPPLTLTFSADERTCAAAERVIAAGPACRAFDESACPRPDALKARPLASDQYGYTEVSLAPPVPSASFTIVYLQTFRGNQQPRQMETWKVDSIRLQEVLQISPGVITFEDRYQYYPGPKADLPGDTNAKEFGALLQESEKISNEWSPTADLNGEPHAVVRDCYGGWFYGGYFRCARVVRLTFMKLADGAKAARSCEFAVVEKN